MLLKIAIKVTGSFLLATKSYQIYKIKINCKLVDWKQNVKFNNLINEDLIYI
jgi:hypothetical protein